METNLVVQFQGFVTDLTTVEKRSIVALTEIVRDALQNQPYSAQQLATVIINRIIEVRRFYPLFIGFTCRSKDVANACRHQPT